MKYRAGFPARYFLKMIRFFFDMWQRAMKLIRNKNNHYWFLLVMEFMSFAVALAPDIARATDVLEKPAMMTSRWSTLVQLSVARAGKRIVSVGERGVILLSDDDGKSWRQAKDPVSTSLTRVAFASDKTGWALGHNGVVLKTIDGGENWTKQFDGKEALRLNKSKPESHQGELASPGSVQNANDGSENPLLALHFFSEQTGIVAGAYGAIFRTEDGGAHWTSLMSQLGDHNDRHIYDIRDVNGVLFLIGEQGDMFKSGDMGRTYAKVVSPSRGSYFGSVASGTSLIVFGLKGSIDLTENLGQTWVSVKQNDTSVTAGIRLSNGAIILGNEAGQIFRSTDNGKSFDLVAVRNPAPFADLVEASDGAIIQCGLRGVSRLEFVAEKKGVAK